jgi:hypothetical protein
MNHPAETPAPDPEFVLPSGLRARLRMPALGEMLLLWYPRVMRTPARAAVFIPAEIERIVDTIDGESVDREQARKILNDRAAFAAYLRARNRWLDVSSAEGLMLAQCPHCQRWEADLSPFVLAVGLGVGFWPTVDEDSCLAVPALATDLARPQRSGNTVRTSRLRFHLPSLALNFESAAHGGSFATGPVDARERALEAERLRLRASDPEAYGDWDAGFGGVRAMLKLGAALGDVDGDADGITLDRLSNLALCDFLFLDNVHYLTRCVPLPDDSPLHLTCANCGGRFAPVQ